MLESGFCPRTPSFKGSFDKGSEKRSFSGLAMPSSEEPSVDAQTPMI